MICRGKSRYVSEFFVASTDLKRAPGGGVVLKHGLVMVGQHLLQGAGHRVAPQQVVVQRTICVKPEKKKSNYQGLQNGISIGDLMNELTSYWGPGSIACQSNHKQDDPAVKITKSRAIKKKYLEQLHFWLNIDFQGNFSRFRRSLASKRILALDSKCVKPI